MSLTVLTKFALRNGCRDSLVKIDIDIVNLEISLLDELDGAD